MVERRRNGDRRPRLRARATAAAVAAVFLAHAGCARPSGPPAIRTGTPCAACSMPIQDLRFACERLDRHSWRVYDSIECLLRDQGIDQDSWLADYDSKRLHAADSMWVVRGDFHSPMGGGLAAFLDRMAADEIARHANGRVSRLADVVAGAMR